MWYLQKYRKFDLDKCFHKTVEYGPCMEYTDRPEDKFDCRYKIAIKDYSVDNIGTKDEDVFVSPDILERYKKRASALQWSYQENLKQEARRGEGEKWQWQPCGYFDQLNKAFKASFSIFNYSNFLIFSMFNNKNKNKKKGTKKKHYYSNIDIMLGEEAPEEDGDDDGYGNNNNNNDYYYYDDDSDGGNYGNVKVI